MSTPLGEGSSDNDYHRISDALEKIAHVLAAMFDTVNNMADTMNRISDTLVESDQGRVRDCDILAETFRNHGTQNQPLPRHVSQYSRQNATSWLEVLQVDSEPANRRSDVDLGGGPETLPPLWPRPSVSNWAAESCAPTAKISRNSPTLLSSPASYGSLFEISTASPESINENIVER
ncbi:hypothetical protein HBH98_247060 [Parastagonospora nodorum]|nr:hypothetical protein HBH53_251030 [Parastagonospora nodorum]KAH3956141.1 hypothetical protein HBH51_251680 [Parastagonospora nodorum]KAH4215396.1 hypothetical protein HBI06_253500 [Parastagonospora nodorum]KAH4223091.1 hypothetical protein HBI05_249240 [Parastagonospora nodorum]KAH4333543.1 hypothetical protein HBH98_247060 [Parastagonospora nodorum]